MYHITKKQSHSDHKGVSPRIYFWFLLVFTLENSLHIATVPETSSARYQFFARRDCAASVPRLVDASKTFSTPGDSHATVADLSERLISAAERALLQQ